MNIIEQKLEELSREEEIAQLLEERRIDELNAMILDRFVDIQKSQATDKNKAKEWKKFNLDFAKSNFADIKKLTLKIDAEYLRKQLGCASITCHDGWSFDFRVSLFGEFDSISFSEAVFNDNCWIGAVFKGSVRFDNVTFFDLAMFYESVFENTVSFHKIIFNSDVSFARAEFNDEVFFEIESAHQEASSKNKKFHKKQSISFEGAEFAKRADFELKNLNVSNFSFESAVFLSNFVLQIENSTINFFNLSSAMFSKMTRFIPFSREFSYNSLVKTIGFDYATFKGSTVFELNFESCPDFSKCYFFEKHFVKETWPEINDRRIKPEDREKFLFFKRYFASTKNHLRENQYFSYEMRAREKGLERDLGCKFKGKIFRKFVCMVCKLANKKFRKILVARCRVLTRKYFELFLFKCYKWLSSYGSSVERPVLTLVFSFLYFGYYFEVNGVQKPYESSFVRTLNPLYDSGQGFRELIEFQTTISVQSLCNTILLFLIFLGIRNRFKIRN
ncbi:MAG: hypothetical protein KGQ36_02035 [Rickettsiales bacterium]|nr:hypothetical protein [Rickettsiales bacterium]